MLAIDKYMDDNVSKLFWGKNIFLCRLELLPCSVASGSLAAAAIFIIIIIIIIEKVLRNAIAGKKSRGGEGDLPKVPLGHDLRVPLRVVWVRGVIHCPTTSNLSI